MSAKWASKLPRWPPHNIAGRVYDLAHLHPFRYSLFLAARPGQPAREVEVRVAFSAHAFTTGCLITEDPNHHYSTGPRDLRKFCPDRYELSKRLPDVVRKLDGRKCFLRTEITTSSWSCQGRCQPVLNTGYFSTFVVLTIPRRCCCSFRAPT